MSSNNKLEIQIKEIDTELSKIEITQEIFDALRLINQKKILTEKLIKARWDDLSLNEKTLKRKDDFALTEKYYVKFQEDVEQKYIFKKNYVQLVDELMNIKYESTLLTILLKSMNTSMYVDLSHKDCNILVIIEELSKENKPQLSRIVSYYNKLITSQTPF